LSYVYISIKFGDIIVVGKHLLNDSSFWMVGKCFRWHVKLWGGVAKLVACQSTNLNVSFSYHGNSNKFLFIVCGLDHFASKWLFN
jgi:hypothetical protein